MKFKILLDIFMERYVKIRLIWIYNMDYFEKSLHTIYYAINTQEMQICNDPAVSFYTG